MDKLAAFSNRKKPHLAEVVAISRTQMALAWPIGIGASME